MIHRLLAAFRRVEAAMDGNPWRGHDCDLARTWDAVDETTRSIAFFRNVHEVRNCVLVRLNHRAAEGGEYRGVEP